MKAGKKQFLAKISQNATTPLTWSVVRPLMQKHEHFQASFKDKTQKI